MDLPNAACSNVAFGRSAILRLPSLPIATPAVGTMPHGTRFLTALPVYNEAAHVEEVLHEVLYYSPEVLVVDDGSTDGTVELLTRFPQIHVERHARNQGYGAALITAFLHAQQHDYDYLVTIDCDGQHEPQLIPQFVAACREADIVSGSRYLQVFPGASQPPAERREINRLITAELNRRLCLELTDGFCGFKAYRVAALKRLQLGEPGYAMPLELWVQAAHANLRVVELPMPLVYLDEKRSFGGALDDGQTRLQYYHFVLDRSLARVQSPSGSLWLGTLCGDASG